MGPKHEEILQAINESGYLFEQEIATILEKNNFHIQTNAAFIDGDENKSREIDVSGYRSVLHDEENKISIGIRILCECKNNYNPFVFIKRNKSKIDENYVCPNFLFPEKGYEVPLDEKSYTIEDGFKYFGIHYDFPFNQADQKAVQFCKIIRKGKNWKALQDGIYDSILMPIIKCLEYYKEYDNELNGHKWKHFRLYFPVVVLNSDLYSINSHLPTPSLNEENHISFVRELKSKKSEHKFLIDFTNKNGLESYIRDHINPFTEKFLERVTS